MVTLEDLSGHITKSTMYVSIDISNQFTTSPKERKGNKSTVISNIFVEKFRNVTPLDLHVSSKETKVVNADQLTNNVDGTVMKSVYLVDYVAAPINVVDHVEFFNV